MEQSINQEYQFPQIEIDSKIQFRKMPNDQIHSNLLSKAIQLTNDNQLDQAQKLADQFFKRGYVEQCIQIYQKIILASPDADYSIQGLGNKQLAQSYYSWNVYKWYDSQRAKGKIQGSPYDALSLCYLVVLNQQSILKKGSNWYMNMMSKYPKNIGFLLGFANIQYILTFYDQAIRAYDKVINLNPDLINAYVCKALSHEYKRIDKGKSTQLAKNILKSDENNPYALFILAKNVADIDQKIQQLKKADQICPQYTRIKNQIGICYGGSKKDYDEAINWYKKCIQQSPLYYSSYNNIGVNYQLKKEYKQAAKWYYKAAQISSEYQAPHTNLIDIYEALGYSDQQIQQQVNQYKDINKYYFFLKIGVAYYNKKQPNTQKAIFWQSKAIQIDPDDYHAYNSLGITYDQKKDYDKAIENYLKCVQKNPQFCSAYFNAGISFKSLGKLDQAIQMYEKAIQVSPRYSFAYNNLGNIYKNKGQYQQAIFYYLHAVDNNSTYTLALVNLGYSYLKLQKYKQAYKAFQRAKIALPYDNNSLNANNRAFLKQNLDKFQAEGKQWIKTGEIIDGDKQIFKNFIQSYQNKFGQASNAPVNKIQIPQQQIFNQSILQIIKILNEDKFQLKNFNEIFDIIEAIYQDDPQYFHIIPLTIIQNFIKQVIEQKKPIMDVQFQWRKTLKQLNQKLIQKSNKQEATGPSAPDNNQKIQLETFKQVNVNLFKQNVFFKSYEDLLQEIQNVNHMAQKSYIDFSLLVQQVRKKSKGIPAGISTKIPIVPSQRFNAIFKIVSSIFKQQLNHLRVIKLIQKIQENLRKVEKLDINVVVNEAIKCWSQEITAILQHKFQNKTQTVCNIKDFIQAKCLFNTIEDLHKGLKVAEKYCNQFGFKIIGFQNQLNSSQKFAKINISIFDSTCELTLSLKKANEQSGRMNLQDQIEKISNHTLGVIFGSYLFMQKGVKYSFSQNCQDITMKLKNKNSEQDIKLKEQAENLLLMMKGSKKMSSNNQ